MLFLNSGTAAASIPEFSLYYVRKRSILKKMRIIKWKMREIPTISLIKCQRSTSLKEEKNMLEEVLDRLWEDIQHPSISISAGGPNFEREKTMKIISKEDWGLRYTIIATCRRKKERLDEYISQFEVYIFWGGDYRIPREPEAMCLSLPPGLWAASRTSTSHHHDIQGGIHTKKEEEKQTWLTSHASQLFSRVGTLEGS